MEEFDTDMEKCIIKCQWEVNNEERKAEQKKVCEEASEERQENVKVVREEDTKEDRIDFRDLRATDFKNNKRVILPKPGDDNEEIRRTNLKGELRKIVIKYRQEKCDKFGNLLDNNLSETQLKNMKNLKTRIKQEDLVCSQTDKTGKLTLDTFKNVTEKMEKHIKDDKVINEKQVRTIENKLNNHMQYWVRILQPGKNNNQTKRVKSNLVTKDNQVPILRGTSKDHKEAEDETVGPDLRPIMGACVGPNIGLSDLGSMVVRRIAENADIGLVATSTEEVIEKIEDYNKNRSSKNLKKVIIASMDIEKCYPNILSLESAQIIRRMWEESNLIMEGIEVDNLCKYLGKFLKTDEIVREGFEELVYTRKIKKRTSKKINRKNVKCKKVKKKLKDKVTHLDTSSREGADTLNTISEEGIDKLKGDDTLGTVEKEKKDIVKKKKTTQEWIKPKRTPTFKEQKSLFGKALEILLVTCMDNHVYLFDKKVRVQKKGGPIGLKLTGEIFDCVMIDWDKELLKRLEKSQMTPEIYTRFKDDIEIAIESLEKGSKLIEDKIIIDDTKKEMDKDETDTKVTMEVIQNVANSINPMIKLTVDTPCNHDDGKLPVLDIKVDVNHEKDNRIDFEFFEKPTKNPCVILASSALSNSQKRTILTQECLRRLRNTKLELGLEIQNKHLNVFMLKLKNSGYSKKFRKEIVDSALKAFEKMVTDHKSGVKPLYRSKEWNKEDREKSKLNKKHNWWNKEGAKIQYKSVLFVTPTPGGLLAGELRKREAELNKHSTERLKIVEKGGLKVKDILSSKSSSQKSKCSQKSCPLCTPSTFVEVNPEDDHHPCNTNNVGYKWSCINCLKQNLNQVYEGESGRSARVRGNEHVRDLENKNEKSALYKHITNIHQNEDVKFRMEITSKFKDALTRQANEAVRIFSRPAHELLNSKSEFNHPPMARVVVEKKNKLGCDKTKKNQKSE